MNTVKYTFNKQFAPGTRPARPKPEPKYDAKAVDKVREDAFASGVAAGRQQAEGESAHMAAVTLTQIAAQLQQMQAQEEARRRMAQANAARLAQIIGTRLAASLIGRRPLAEIEALVADCLETCRQEAKLVIRLNDALVEDMKAKIGEMRQQQHFEGEIIVLGDAAIAPGDCRIEWKDGGAERDSEALGDAIATIVERYASSLENA